MRQDLIPQLLIGRLVRHELLSNVLHGMSSIDFVHVQPVNPSPFWFIIILPDYDVCAKKMGVHKVSAVAIYTKSCYTCLHCIYI